MDGLTSSRDYAAKKLPVGESRVAEARLALELRISKSANSQCPLPFSHWSADLIVFVVAVLVAVLSGSSIRLRGPRLCIISSG